jgi:hypothetical protein
VESLSHKHVEALLSSESEDGFDINCDRSDNSNSDITDSESRNESYNDWSNSECDTTIPLAQKKQKVNE